MTARLFPVLTLLVLLGCEERTPEARLEMAGEQLEQTEDTLESVNDRIAHHEQTLAELRKERRQIRNRVLTLEERVEARATDVALFRAVQSALLADEALVQSAISVDVESGVVRLSGLVTSEAKEAAAMRIAGGVPGVGTIESRIEIEAEGAGTN